MKKNHQNQIEDNVNQMAEINDLPIPPEYHPGVVANFGKITEIYQMVEEFTLPEKIESAPTFEP